jgi:hypothetical protein
MSFASIAVGSPFYILRRADKPTLEVGVVKSKSDKPPYQQNAAVPMAFGNMGNQTQQTSIIVDVNGKEVQVPDVPNNIEIASDKDGCMYSGSREAMLQAVDGMIQTSKKALEQVEYHKSVLTEGEKMLETLNPQYAEGKQQARTIKQLEERQAATDKKLDDILTAIRAMNSNNKG